ncbi:MAG TPA: ribosome maturation factor RimP [Solirubrobacteraceae bacterium]|jgi:ribosome maturation factor RimP
MTTLQADIERRLAEAEPDVEVLLAEVIPSPTQPTLRIFIDHSSGVTLGLCERVSTVLADLRESYALEVSSPGTERPLSKPDHFRRYIGRCARVRVRSPESVGSTRARGDERSGARRRSFTGELVGASEQEITLAAEDGIVAIPYSEIRRSNLVEE